MARQGLMDDAGYDFFDVSDCANYESCREDAYNDGYEKGRADAIKEVSRAMYHQCFECNNDENMQRWDSGNWIRYKLFENVIEQLKEQK